MARRPAATIEQLLTAGIAQPEIRQVALRYLALVATTLRPSTLALRADSLIVFAEYLAAAHPEVRRLPQLTRTHSSGPRPPTRSSPKPTVQRLQRRDTRDQQHRSHDPKK